MHTSTGSRGLPRKLGAWTGAAVVVGVIIGSGIYKVPAPVAADTGSLTGVALVWVLGGLISLFGALSVAELAAAFPDAGGPYVYLRESFGKPLAFMFGWMWLVTTPNSWAAQAVTFASYFGSAVAFNAFQVKLVAASLITLLSGVSYYSVGLGAWVQNLSTGAKLIGLAGLAVALFAAAPHPGATLAGVASGGVLWGGVGVALIATLWAYDGWANLTALSGEMKEPQKSLPKALIMGTLVTLAVYLTMNAAFAVSLPFDQLAASKAVASDAVTAVLGSGAAVVIVALVMVSTFGSMNGSILSDPRVFYAMAEDGLFFKSVGKIHPRFQTPHVAIVFSWALAIVFVFCRDFLDLAEAYVLGIWPFLALSVVGLFILRRRQPDLARPYRVWGYPVVPVLFVLGTLLVIGDTYYELFRDAPLITAINLGLILAGLPIYWVWVRLQDKKTP
ncbi:MAG TPA: amino acid permease [Gammaproteobacteria bacterium]|jgi:APA family basic amino acid/polyamine antiporter|nr:amino acid permease [Gammaproteobacteria bacterium]